jgi:GDPmannose 4,6-dehydratase
MEDPNEPLVLTSLKKINTENRHSRLFPHNKIIYTSEYSKEFFRKVIAKFDFKQIYVFGSISIVNDSSYSEKEYLDSTIGLVESLTQALISCKKIDSVIIFHSSSVEIFGKNLSSQQTETTPLNPQSAYANGKALAHVHFQNLREKGICRSINGIMYNHESIYRKKDFVTQKICLAVAEIFLGQRKTIPLGRLDVFRDWSYANDVISAAKLGLDKNLTGDYILASGVTRSLDQWISEAFKAIKISDWGNYIELNNVLVRTDQEYLPDANVSKSRAILNLKETISFESLIQSMVHYNIEILKTENSQNRF